MVTAKMFCACVITSFLYKTGVITVQAVGMPCPVSQQADNTTFICQFRTRSSKWLGYRRWNYRANTGKQLQVCMPEWSQDARVVALRAL